MDWIQCDDSEPGPHPKLPFEKAQRGWEDAKEGDDRHPADTPVSTAPESRVISQKVFSTDIKSSERTN